MNDDDRLLLDVRSWLKDEDVVLPDAEQAGRLVAAGLPQTRQTRRRRWPLPSRTGTSVPPGVMPGTEYQASPIPATNGHSPTVLGRTQSMLSPVKAITAGAVVFALGGAFLIGQSFDQQSSMPGAESEPEVAAPVEFTAKWAFGPDVRSEAMEAVGSVVTTRGGAWRPRVITQASDPRLQGTLSIAANSNQYAATGGGEVWNYAFRIENEEGAWQQMPTINLDTGDGDLNTTTGVLVGEGGYAGLIAVFDNLSENSTWDLHGYIIDGELPPAPEPYVAE